MRSRASSTRPTIGMGPLPPSVLNLADYGRIPRHGGPAGHREHRPGRANRRLKVQAAGQARPCPAGGARAIAARADARAPGALKISLEVRGQARHGGAPACRPQDPPRKGGSSGRNWRRAGGRRGRARARSSPGFSKEEILRPAKEDPRAPGGVFESVGGVLSELLDQG